MSNESIPGLSDELRRSIHHDYRLVRAMHAPNRIKRKFLTDLFSQFEHNWKVVGITSQALEIFQSFDFRQKPRMGITRAHLNDRNRFFDEMLQSDMSEDQMWTTYWNNDRTVLRGKGEEQASYIAIDFSRGLFKDKGLGWSHKNAERLFLAELWRQHLDQSSSSS